MKYDAIFCAQHEIKQFYDCFVWGMNRRSEGRSKIEVENIIFADFLLNCIDHSRWNYPVTIKYQDRPDFVIKSGNEALGIEVTEQWSKNFGHALVLAENSDGLIESSDFNIKTDTKKLKGKHVAKLVSKKELTGPPSMGYQEEENWVRRTLNTVEIKAEKYLKFPDFENYSENYVVIFDVRPESPDLNDVTEDMLAPLYSLGKSSPFSKIYCLDSHILEIDLIKKTFVKVRDKYPK